MYMISIYYLDVLFIISVYSTTDLCSDKLLEDRTKVPDSAFIESSYKDNFRGRLARESPSNDVAWCPKDQISNYKKEYLIIDLGEIYVLKMLMTKGLSRHGYITASSYIIEYRRENNTPWIEYRERGIAKKIMGNKDYLTEKYESMDSPIIARWIKIYPLADTVASVCLILQIYGCKYSSNVLEYRMPNGNMLYHFDDYIYDGSTSGGSLVNGLGKLVTVVQSHISDPFNASNGHLVGWSRDLGASNTVPITFRFDTVRNFSSMSIETSNYFPKNVKTFSEIEISFSIDDLHNDGSQTIKKVIDDDLRNSEMRFIRVNLKHNVGRFIKITLSFRSQWIVIRKVEFISEVTTDYQIVKPPVTKDGSVSSRRPMIPFAENDYFSIPLAYSLVIVISILIILLLIGIPCITIIIKRQKSRKKKCKEALQRHYHEERARFLSLTQQQFKDPLMNQSQLFTVSNFNPNLASLSNPRIMQESSIYTSLAGSDTDSNCPSDKQPYMVHSMGMLNSCPIFNPVTSNHNNNNNNRSLSNDYSATSFMTLGSNGTSYVPYYTHNPQVARSQVNIQSQYDITNQIPICLDRHPIEPPHNYPMAMIGSIQESIQGPVGNSRFLSTVTAPDMRLLSTLNQLKTTTTFPRIDVDNIKYISTIGRGTFGSILTAEWTTDQDFQFSSGKKFICNEYNSLRESLTSSIETENGPNQAQEKQIASVKLLSKDAPAKIKKEFYEEIKRILSFNHKNFVSILNFEETSAGGCVVVSEYTHLDDMFSYLQSYTMCEFKGMMEMRPKLISQSKLLFVASQAASAMKHLESLQIVHCDLACRNILVMNDQLLVKISDLAMSQDKFSPDYVPIDCSLSSHIHKSMSCLLNQSRSTSVSNLVKSPNVVLLPIRWMCWQSLMEGTFSTKSDVYSFGVTMWELLTLCQWQPFSELTNEQVMINSNLQAHSDSRSRLLTLPSNISVELIDFITHCTQCDDTKRPTFNEIDMFLQHKTVGCQS